MAMRLTGDRTTRSDFAPGELDAPSPHRFVPGAHCLACGAPRPAATEETRLTDTATTTSRDVIDGPHEPVVVS